MTEEQIRQNAEMYADKLCKRECAVEWKRLVDTYIEGSNSRKDEFERLKAEIEDMTFLLRQVCNPWISVEERLPEMYEDVVVLNNGKPLLSRRYWIARWKEHPTEWQWSKSLTHVTHWMPIPNIKKGEQSWKNLSSTRSLLCPR